MKISYICSPFRAETEEQKQKHIEYARELMGNLLDCCFPSEELKSIPIVPHLLYPQVINDDIKTCRDLALFMCYKWIEKSDVIYVGCRYGTSDGMKQEIALAEKLGKKIIYLEEKNYDI